MLEKLLSLFLHAKSGAVATVLVLGASGALVTATVDNGMTTITITQPGQSSESSTTSGTTTTVDEAILALFTPTSHEDDPTAPATGKGCSDEAHETNGFVKEVNDAYKGFHQEVAAMHKDARTAEDRALVKEADKALKATRQAAVKFFHDAFDCDHEDDVDEVDTDTDTNTDTDTDTEDEDTSGSTSTDTTVVFTGDPKDVVELAIAAMEEVVENLKAALEDPEESTANTTNTQNGKSDSDKPGNKGKGKGRSR
jgi:hypothetical protein